MIAVNDVIIHHSSTVDSTHKVCTDLREIGIPFVKSVYRPTILLTWYHVMIFGIGHEED